MIKTHKYWIQPYILAIYKPFCLINFQPLKDLDKTQIRYFWLKTKLQAADSIILHFILFYFIVLRLWLLCNNKKYSFTLYFFNLIRMS